MVKGNGCANGRGRRQRHYLRFSKLNVFHKHRKENQLQCTRCLISELSVQSHISIDIRGVLYFFKEKCGISYKCRCSSSK